MSKLSVISAAAFACAAAVNVPLYAAPAFTEILGTTSVTAPVLSNDLLQTNFKTATLDSGSINGEGTKDLNIVRDGTFTADTLSALLTPENGAVVRYTLDTETTNTAGFDITAINSYGGWQDSGRDRQTFTIEYSKVGDPTTFLPVDSVDQEPANSDGGRSGSLAAFTTNLTNVGQLRFTFGTQENGHAGYGEFDVIGTPAAVPEPASLGLLGMGAMGLLARRRRTR